MEIEVKRPAQWADMIRTYEILIDGVKVSEISRGETIKLAVPDEQFTIQARIDWCTSNVISSNNISRKLIVKNSFSGNPLKWLFILYYVSFGKNGYLTLNT